jgi:hypothetical protein
MSTLEIINKIAELRAEARRENVSIAIIADTRNDFWRRMGWLWISIFITPEYVSIQRLGPGMIDTIAFLEGEEASLQCSGVYLEEIAQALKGRWIKEPLRRS